MDASLQQFILDLVNEANDMTIATVRADGYPQATTVSYASEGMMIYFAIGASSQKAENIRRSAKVSLTINSPYKSWGDIKGLSMGALASILTDSAQIAHAQKLLHAKFPAFAQLSPEAVAQILMVRVEPQVISVLDYSKGFGHTQLVTPGAEIARG